VLTIGVMRALFHLQAEFAGETLGRQILRSDQRHDPIPAQLFDRVIQAGFRRLEGKTATPKSR
jgi:hypothetical protein